MRIILVGEVNPYGMDPNFALYHLPRHASGNRLREHLGLSDVDYEGLLKANLCDGKWSMKAARVMAGKIYTATDDVAVMLGSKVRSAFENFCFVPKFFERHLRLVSLPHPSGLNRLWNEPGARGRARAIMHEVAPEVPWGSSG